MDEYVSENALEIMHGFYHIIHIANANIFDKVFQTFFFLNDPKRNILVANVVSTSSELETINATRDRHI